MAARAGRTKLETRGRAAGTPRARRAPAALFAALCSALALAACVHDRETVRPLPYVWTDAVATDPLEPIDPTLLAGLDRVRAELGGGSDEDARRALAGVFARRPEGRALEVAEGFRRVLDGRAVEAATPVRLVAEPAGDAAAPRTRVTLVVESANRETVVWEPGPATLARLVRVVSPLGTLASWREERVVELPSPLEVRPGASVSVELGEFEPSLAGALACHEQFTLGVRSGTYDYDGEALPARARAALGAERTTRAPFLPTDPVEPAALIEFLLRPGTFARDDPALLPPLLERAVRIPDEQVADTLIALVPVADALREDELQRAQPALAWLARTDKPADALAWRAWLRGHRERVLAERAGRRAPLELPAPR